MTGLQQFWTIVLAGAVLLFLVVEVVVVVGGARDLKEMMGALLKATGAKGDE